MVNLFQFSMHTVMISNNIIVVERAYDGISKKDIELTHTNNNTLTINQSVGKTRKCDVPNVKWFLESKRKESSFFS